MGKFRSDTNIKKGDLTNVMEGNNKRIAELFVELLDGSVQTIEQDYVKKNIYNELQDNHNKLQDEFDTAKKKWEQERQDLINQVDNIGQYSRRDNIKIIGVEQKDDENVEQIVIDIASDAGVSISKEDISIAHRINTVNDSSNPSVTNAHGGQKKVPSIIAKIKSRSVRNKIFLARKKLHENSTPTHTGAKIFDDITPLRSRIMYALRNRKVGGTEEKKYKFVWSNEGRIFARTEEDSKRKVIHPITRKEVLPKPAIINKAQDLEKLGWTKEEILDIIDNNNKRV